MASPKIEKNWLKERQLYLQRAPRSLCLVVHYETLEKLNFDFSQLVELASVATSAVSLEHGEWRDGTDPLADDRFPRFDDADERASLLHENIGCLYEVDAQAAIDLKSGSEQLSVAPVLLFADDDHTRANDTVQESPSPSADENIARNDDGSERSADSLLVVTCERPKMWLLKPSTLALGETDGATSPPVWEQVHAPKIEEVTPVDLDEQRNTTRVDSASPELGSDASHSDDQSDNKEAVLLDDTCRSDSATEGETVVAEHPEAPSSGDVSEGDAHHVTQELSQSDATKEESSDRFEGAMCCDIMMICDQVKCQVPSEALLASRLEQLEEVHGCVAQVTLVAPALMELSQIWSAYIFTHANPLAIRDTASSTTDELNGESLPRVTMDDRDLSLVHLLTTDHHVLSKSRERFLPDLREFLASYTVDEPVATIVFFSDRAVSFDATYLLSPDAE